MAAGAAEQSRCVEVGLPRDERLGHAGQQAIADVPDVRAARRAAQAVVGAVRRGLIHGDAGRRVRPPDVVHGAYLSPGLPPRLQTWKSRPQAAAGRRPHARERLSTRGWHRVCKTSRPMETLMRLAVASLVLLPLVGRAPRAGPAAPASRGTVT